MNYYERHLGDYARDTAHLSLLEHGVYTLLLDRYYATEEPIPEEQAYRLARARTDEERAAVDIVLAEFFQREQTSGNPVGFVWVNRRVEEEIEKARQRINTARENGRKGGRPRKRPEKNPTGTQQKPSGFCLGTPAVTQPVTQTKAHQTPDTISTEAIASGASAPPDDPPEARDPIWHSGLAFLRRKGVTERQARSFLGKLKREAGDIQAAALLAQAEDDDITDPVPWLAKAAAAARARASPGRPSIAQNFAEKTYVGTPDDEWPEHLRTN